MNPNMLTIREVRMKGLEAIKNYGDGALDEFCQEMEIPFNADEPPYLTQSRVAAFLITQEQLMAQHMDNLVKQAYTVKSAEEVHNDESKGNS